MNDLPDFFELWSFRETIHQDTCEAFGCVYPDLYSLFGHQSIEEFWQGWDKNYPEWETDSKEMSDFWHDTFAPVQQKYQKLVSRYAEVLDVDYYAWDHPRTFYNFVFRSGLYRIENGSPRKKGVRGVVQYLLNTKYNFHLLEPYDLEQPNVLAAIFPPVKSFNLAARQVLKLNESCAYPYEEYAKLFSHSKNSHLQDYLKIGASHPRTNGYYFQSYDSIARKIKDKTIAASRDDWTLPYEWDYAMEVLSWIDKARAKIGDSRLKNLLSYIFYQQIDDLDVIFNYKFDASAYEAQKRQFKIEAITTDFKAAKSLEEAKKMRNRLAMIYHADLAGDHEIMLVVNREYDRAKRLFAR